MTDTTFLVSLLHVCDDDDDDDLALFSPSMPILRPQGVCQ